MTSQYLEFFLGIMSLHLAIQILYLFLNRILCLHLIFLTFSWNFDFTSRNSVFFRILCLHLVIVTFSWKYEFTVHLIILTFFLNILRLNLTIVI